tara:strand:+ start:1130 stop:1312 length:183 start_codon:yes stop_codon:yes gene_type:complete
MNIPDDLINKILTFIKIKTEIKYIQHHGNDGEQMISVFVKNKYPLNSVNKYWNDYYKTKY